MKTTVDDARLATDWRWQLALRVAAGQSFQKSPRLSSFLLYVTEKALQEHPEEATEQQIGVHVFGRPAGYDSGSDNLVRSQARQLRLKLDRYFAAEGSAETTTIVVPKGRYLPSFIERPSTTLLAPAVTPGQSAVLALSAATILLAVVCICQAIALRRTTAGNPGGHAGAFTELWSSIFKNGQEVLAVVPDHTYATVQASAHRDIRLSEYLSQQYASELKDLAVGSGLAKILPGYYDLHLTGLYAVTDIAPIDRVPRPASAPLSVRWPHDIGMRELNAGNAILIGSRNSNPWVELFDAGLNFDFRWNPETDYNYCVNRSPRPGEQAEYRPQVSGDTRVVYGGIAFLPPPQRRGNALIILGASMAGSEIAAEFVTNERLSAGLLEQLRQSSKGRLPYFELLLKTTSIAAQPGRPEVVAYRTIPE